MTIATAVQKGQFIYVYDANGRELCHIYVGITGTLQGYTSSTVSAQRDKFLYTYDEKGMQLSASHAPEK
jgi:hypothetical protein